MSNEIQTTTSKPLAVSRYTHREPRKNSLTVTTEELDKLKFNPLEQSVRIAKGEALTQDHPLLALIVAWCSECEEVVEQSDDKEQAMLNMHTNLVNMARKFLTDSWTSHELRSKHTMFIADKLYSAANTDAAVGEGSAIDRSPLTRQELEHFRCVFDDLY